MRINLHSQSTGAFAGLFHVIITKLFDFILFFFIKNLDAMRIRSMQIEKFFRCWGPKNLDKDIKRCHDKDTTLLMFYSETPSEQLVIHIRVLQSKLGRATDVAMVSVNLLVTITSTHALHDKRKTPSQN